MIAAACMVAFLVHWQAAGDPVGPWRVVIYEFRAPDCRVETMPGVVMTDIWRGE